MGERDEEMKRSKHPAQAHGPAATTRFVPGLWSRMRSTFYLAFGAVMVFGVSRIATTQLGQELAHRDVAQLLQFLMFIPFAGYLFLFGFSRASVLSITLGPDQMIHRTVLGKKVLHYRDIRSVRVSTAMSARYIILYKIRFDGGSFLATNFEFSSAQVRQMMVQVARNMERFEKAGPQQIADAPPPS